MRLSGKYKWASGLALFISSAIVFALVWSLHIVGFSSYAREIKKEDVTYMSWDDFDPYTNMQHGLQVARKLLDKERCTNKQVILIS